MNETADVYRRQSNGAGSRAYRGDAGAAPDGLSTAGPEGRRVGKCRRLAADTKRHQKVPYTRRAARPERLSLPDLGRSDLGLSQESSLYEKAHQNVPEIHNARRARRPERACKQFRTKWLQLPPSRNPSLSWLVSYETQTATAQNRLYDLSIEGGCERLYIGGDPLRRDPWPGLVRVDTELARIKAELAHAKKAIKDVTD